MDIIIDTGNVQPNDIHALFCSDEHFCENVVVMSAETTWLDLLGDIFKSRKAIRQAGLVEIPFGWTDETSQFLSTPTI